MTTISIWNFYIVRPCAKGEDDLQAKHLLHDDRPDVALVDDVSQAHDKVLLAEGLVRSEERLTITRLEGNVVPNSIKTNRSTDEEVVATAFRRVENSLLNDLRRYWRTADDVSEPSGPLDRIPRTLEHAGGCL